MHQAHFKWIGENQWYELTIKGEFIGFYDQYETNKLKKALRLLDVEIFTT